MHEKFLVSVEPHFAGHESFPLRANWLPKAISLVKTSPPALLNEEETMIQLGVGKNMARSIRHWGESTGIINRTDDGFEVSTIGEIIFGDRGDPYLEDKDTLWLIHYLVVSNGSKNGLWYYLFNIFSGDYLKRDDFIRGVSAWAAKHAKKTPSEKTLERDFLCCMSMYAKKDRQLEGALIADLLASPIKELRIITGPIDHSAYYLRRITGLEFSPWLFAFALLDFWESQESQETVSVDQILHGEGSPGRIFRLSENAIVHYLREFEKITKKGFIFDNTAGIQQVLKIKDKEFNKEFFLSGHYRTRMGAAA